MKTLLESYIGSKPPGERVKFELENLVPWFKKHGTGVLKNVSDEVLIDILQNCSLKSYVKDELIIAQGDIGDRFFIVAYGQVNIYVNDNNDPPTGKFYKGNPPIVDKDSRHLFGNCVLNEGPGYSFGEYAFFDESNSRKASVISATETLLIVLFKDKYIETLKNMQQGIINEREMFINQNPLFSEWNFKIKKMLMMSLKKVIVPFETNLVTQGEQWSGLIFITKGSGQLIIDPLKHEVQFSQWFPLDFTMYDKRYQEFPELKRITDLKEPFESTDELMSKHIRQKRSTNYGSSETSFINRKTLICSVQPGEIIGDFEFLFNLKYNLYSIVSKEEVEAFLLDTTNIDRVLKKISGTDIQERLKQIIQSKMDHREKYFDSVPVPLLKFLKCKLYDKKLESVKPMPALKTRKKLPADRLEFQHLLKMYLADKAALCRPYVKGSVFLRDLMHKNACDRSALNVENSVKMSETKVKVPIDINDSRFPVPQERVFELHKSEPNSIKLLELLYNEIIKYRLSQDSKKFAALSSYPEVDLEHHSVNNNEMSHDREVDHQRELNAANSPTFPEKSEIKYSLESESGKNKSKNSSDSLEFNEYLNILQSSQIKFLNSLCSEKSFYELKSDFPSNINENNKKAHFLPSLKSQKDVINKERPPKRGARILVKKRRCFALDTDYNLSNHVHNRFFMVEKLQFDN